MTRVDGVAGPGAVVTGRAKAAGGGGGFRVEGEEASGAAEGVRAAAPVGLAGMLALQEAEAETEGNRRGKRHGQAMLQALAGLQLALLGGGQAEMAALERLAAQAPNVTDAKLAGLLQSIRLRARIELLRGGVENP